MATAKQLAALAKARAARKKKLGASKKKTTTKKRVGTSQKKPSVTTKKAPSKRLKARRAKNVTPGYYPNPVKKRSPAKTKTVYMLCAFKGKKIVGYWTGYLWDDMESAGKCYANQNSAVNAWNNKASKVTGQLYRGGVISKKK